MSDQVIKKERIGLFFQQDFIDSYAFIRDAISILKKHDYLVDSFLGAGQIKAALDQIFSDYSICGLRPQNEATPHFIEMIRPP